MVLPHPLVFPSTFDLQRSTFNEGRSPFNAAANRQKPCAERPSPLLIFEAVRYGLSKENEAVASGLARPPC